MFSKFQELRLETQKRVFKLYKLWKQSWPISWSRFKEPKILFKAFLSSPYQLRILLLITSIATLVSLGFLTFGIYLAFTVPVPAQGGVFREAVSVAKFRDFNPILNDLSYGEERVISLLYHPLYKVNQPDFLNQESAEITIEPVLLDTEPQWLDADLPAGEGYKNLQLTLKENLKWSDGSPLTTQDINYTFQLLRQTGSNPKFNSVLQGLEIQIINDTTFTITATRSNPQLIYELDIIPISRNFYSIGDINSLRNDPRTTFPTVTSGYFSFQNDSVQDPDSQTKSSISNPFRSDPSSGSYQKVILEKNQYQNYGSQPYLEKYVVSNYEDFDPSSKNSLQTAYQEGNVHLFTRPITTSKNSSTQEILNSTDIERKIIGTNTYYSLFFNLQRRDELVSKTLRKYLFCSLLNFEFDKEKYPDLEKLPTNKTLLPLQLTAQANPDCPENPRDILAGSNYEIRTDDRTQITQIFQKISNRQTLIDKLRLLAFNSTLELAQDLQKYLTSIGLATVIIDPNEAETRLESQRYTFSLLPVSITNLDTYNLFGSGGRNLLSTNLSNDQEILDFDTENNLLKYSQSNLTDTEAKQNIQDFFNSQYTTFNLSRQRLEIFYQPDLEYLLDYTTKHSNYSQYLWTDLSQFYLETKRGARS